MAEEGYQTPRRKYTVESYHSDLKHKYSTINSCCSKDPQRLKEFQHLQAQEHRRQNRLNSLMKVRKDTLVRITGENQQIYLKINRQQSHYPAAKIRFTSLERNKNKQNQQDKLLGPIGNWEHPSSFLPAERSVMGQHQWGLDNTKMVSPIIRLNSLEKATNCEKIMRGKQKGSKLKDLLFFTPSRQRILPDIYIS